MSDGAVTIEISARKHTRKVSFLPGRDGTSSEELQRTVATAFGLPMMTPFPYVLRDADGTIHTFSQALRGRFTLVTGPEGAGSGAGSRGFLSRRPDPMLLVENRSFFFSPFIFEFFVAQVVPKPKVCA
jgi:hypothetical protein